MLLVCTFSSYSQPSLSNELRENITLRVESGLNPGMVIGLINEKGVEYFSFGIASSISQLPVDENTVFEIGSISKTFTGVLLANEVKKGTMNLDDPIGLYLPKEVKSPTFDGTPIQLAHLSNHTSGLPSLPTNFAPTNPTNPYADYTVEQLYAFLETYELTREAGSQYEYSNYAAGLLGHLLASKNNMTYEELMNKVIAKPLGLKNTVITLSSKMKGSMATGHNMGFEVSNWDLPTLAGAGAIKSTVTDMVKYVNYNMGLKKHKLYEAMQLSHQNSRQTDDLPSVGLGWHRTGANADLIWHNGGTGGFRSFVGFSESEKRGVVILTNSSESVDDLGFRILNSAAPLRTFKPSISTVVRLAIDQDGVETGIASYGKYKEQQSDKYEFGEAELNRLGNTYQVIGENEKAIAVLKLNTEAFPNSSSTFSSLGEVYYKGENKEAAIAYFKKAFELSPSNKHAEVRLKELGVDTANLNAEVTVSTEVLDTYVGKYELAPGFLVSITIEENQLKAQATGQPVFPIYPKSENVFFFKVVDAQLTFNTTEEGTVKSVTLLQGGREIEGKKL